jgi:heme/copper-type cytochrome/quinol oxidase subunit 2
VLGARTLVESGLDAASWAPSLGELAQLVVAQARPRAGFNLFREGVGTQRRLRVTRGLVLPADVPMHVTCGSKDVIHSWAIPGLGVKIDCIPGYNSHRRLLLRWRGAYWGQCMEVCGRYHHWMPILVRVVHKDVFAGWCLAFLRTVESRAAAEARAASGLRAVAGWRLATLVPACAAAEPSVSLLALL